MLLRFISAAPGGRTLDVVNGVTNTGYSVLGEADFGDAAWEHQFAGARGTQGARPSSATPQNRTATWPIRIAGTSKDDLAAKKRALELIVNEMRRFGGQVLWQSNSQSLRQWFDVKTAASAVAQWGIRAEVINRAVVAVSVVCAPYLEGDCMDVFDQFQTGSATSDYTFDAGASGTTVDTGLQRMTFSSTGERRFYHSLTNYRPADAEATVAYVIGSTAGSPNIGVILRRQDANNYLVAQIDTAAAQLRIKKVIAGVETSLANVAITALTTGTGYWLRFRTEGNNLYAEHWGSNPYAGGSASNATASVSYTLTSAEQPQFGKGVKGQAGGRIAVAGTPANTYITSFRVWPYTYRGVKLPRELALPAIEGDADALADFILNVRNASVNFNASVVGWTRAPIEPWNMAWNGGAEGADGNAYPWNTAAVSGMSLAATSVARQSSVVYAGNYSGRMVTPATSGAGVNHPIFRQFKKGVTYTMEATLRSNSGSSANAAIMLGTPGDGNSTTVTATLPAAGTWTVLTVTWAPTADREVGYAVIKSNAAAGYTIDFDNVRVYEGVIGPSANTHVWGRGGTLPFGTIYAGSREDATTPNAFDLVVDAQGYSGWTTQVTPAANNPYSVTWRARIDPYLMWPDDYERSTVDLELWARVYYGVDLITNGTARVQASIGAYVEASTAFQGVSGTTPREPGCNPKIVPVGLAVAEWRWLRLGVIPVPTREQGQAERMLHQVTLSFTGTAGSGADRLLKFDCLNIVPARSRFTASALGSNLLPIRVVRSDLTGQTGVAQSVFAPTWDLAPYFGAGGSAVELPAGGDLLAYVRPSIATVDTSDGETGDVNAKYTPMDVHFAVTPRWALLRDA